LCLPVLLPEAASAAAASMVAAFTEAVLAKVAGAAADGEDGVDRR
jgi:hypothetical protein